MTSNWTSPSPCMLMDCVLMHCPSGSLAYVLLKDDILINSGFKWKKLTFTIF